MASNNTSTTLGTTVTTSLPVSVGATSASHADADANASKSSPSQQTYQHAINKSCQYCLCAPSNMQRCSSCFAVYYCDRTCQKNDWKSHKLVCAAKSANCLIPTRLDAISILQTNMDADCWAHAFSFLTARQLGQVSRVNHCFRFSSMKPAAASHDILLMDHHDSQIGHLKRYHLPINLQYGVPVRDKKVDMILPPQVIPSFPKLERMRFDLTSDGDNTAPTKINTDKLFAARLNEWLPQVASTLKHLELPLSLPETMLDDIVPNLSTCTQLETLILTRFTVQREMLQMVPELPKLKAPSVSTLVVTPDFFTKHNAQGDVAAVAECEQLLPKFFNSLSLSTTLRALEVEHSHRYHTLAYKLIFSTAVFPHLEWLSVVIVEYQGPSFRPLKSDQLVHLRKMGTTFPRLKSLSLTIRMNESIRNSPPRSPARDAEEIAFRDALLDNLHEGLKPLSSQMRSFFMMLTSEMRDDISIQRKNQLDSMIAKRQFNLLSFTHRPMDRKEIDKLVTVMPGLYSFQLQTMRAGRDPSLFTKEAIESIVKHCPSLRYLELMYDPKCMDDILPLTQLKHLKRVFLLPLPDETTTELPPKPTAAELTTPLTHAIGIKPCIVRLLTNVNQTHLPILRHLPPVKRLECDNRELHYEVLFAYAQFVPLALKLQCFQDIRITNLKSYRYTMQTDPEYLNRGVSYRMEHEVQSITQEQYDLLKQLPNIRERKLSESPFKAIYAYAMQSIARDRAAIQETCSESVSTAQNTRLWWMPETLHMTAMNIGSNRCGPYQPLHFQTWIAVHNGHYLEFPNLQSMSRPHLSVLAELVNPKAADFDEAERLQLGCSRLVIQPLLHGKNWINELELIE